ncbi:MAG TPA: hypothetical protein VFG30_14945 [Polyangiales bacterium]|nr:hypothetical protein [Polyangiales bacterium]
MRFDRFVTGLGGLTLLVSIGTGCGGDPAATPNTVGFAGAPAAPTGPTGTTGVTPPTGVNSGIAGAAAPPTGTTTAPPTGMTTTQYPNAQNVPGVPCDVAAVVSDNCTTCHSNPVKFQAPMALMAHSDFMVASKTQPAKKVFQVIPDRINATDIKLRMPPASGTTIAATNLKIFNDWLNAGAQAVTPSCAITVKGGGDVTTQPPPTTGMTMPPTTGGTTAPTTSGGASDVARKYDDPMMKCYEFRAHANGDKTMPFGVTTQPDQYTNFTFMPPWQGMQYARSFRVLDGNTDVIHHWLFYKNATPQADGAVGFSTGAHPDGELVHGWAPGGSDLYFDSDVGLEMPGDVGYTLETHHNNTGGATAPDNSGLEVCVTPMVPKNVASLSWLGTDAISGTSATGTCAPTSDQPIHIIGVQPHMHTKGTYMKGEITRLDGKKEMLHDAPFDFQFQHSYHAMTILMPGESIKTTCTYNAPTSFGEGTNDEMCYLFTLYYPKLSLTNGNPIATLIHGPNTCLQ